MSVPNQTPYIIYNANGLTTVFPFEFYIINAGDIQVSINGTLVTSGYSVSGAGNVGGGNVNFITPPASGTVVMLERVVPTYRLTDYQDNGDLLADTVNKDFDRLWMAIQRSFIYLGLALRRPLLGGPFNAEGYRIENLADPVEDQDAATKKYIQQVALGNLNRTLRVPEPFIEPFPPADQRAGKMPAFDSQGRLDTVLPPSGSASEVMIELASDDGASKIGGSVYVVDTFSDAILSANVKSKQMQTLCHHIPGKGGAEYVKTGTNGIPSTGDESLFYDASGIGWELISNPVNYYQFGAELDGVMDDTLKVIAAQKYANSTGTNVVQSGGTAYVTPNDSNRQIRFSTNTNFHSGFKFRTDNVIGRGFVVYPEYSVTTLSQSDVNISEFLDTRNVIPSLSNYKNSLACVLSSETDLNRKRDEGPAPQLKRQPLVIMEDGYLDAPLWCTFSSVTSIIVTPLNVPHITIDGLCLETFGSLSNTSPIGVQRNNVTLKNLRYKDAGTTSIIPVQSLISVEFARNVVIDNPICDSLSKGIVSFNYVVNTWVSSKVLIKNMNSFDGWAQVDGNYCRDITVEDSTIDRVGSHFRGYDYTFRNLKAVRSRAIEVAGGGRLNVENINITCSTSNTQMVAVAIRGDYGAEWDGDIYINGMTFNLLGVYSDISNISVTALSALIDSTVGAHNFQRLVRLPKTVSVKNVRYIANTMTNCKFAAAKIGCLSSIVSDIVYPTSVSVSDISADNQNSAIKFKVKGVDIQASVKPPAQVQHLYVSVDNVVNIDPLRYSETIVDDPDPTIYIVSTGNNLRVNLRASFCPWMTMITNGEYITSKVSNSIITYFSGTLGSYNRIMFSNTEFAGTRFRGSIPVLINSCVFRKYTDYTGAVVNIGNGQNVDTNIISIRDTVTELGVTINGTNVTASTAKSGYLSATYYQ